MRTYTLLSLFIIFNIVSIFIFLLFFYNNSNNFNYEKFNLIKLSNFAYSSKDYNVRFKDYNFYNKDITNLNFKSTYMDFVYEK